MALGCTEEDPVETRTSTLRAGGRLFTNALSVLSGVRPGAPSILTGRYPSPTG